MNGAGNPGRPRGPAPSQRLGYSRGLIGGQFPREPYGVGIKKGKDDLVRFVDEVMERLLADGRWGKLYYEYLGDISGLPIVADAKLRLPEIE